MTNPLIQKYGKEKQWVSWRMMDRDGKQTKVPISLSGGMASSTDPLTWSTYEEIKSKYENVGIVFTEERTLLGIDIDKCLNKETREIEHKQKEQIEQLIKEANTYTEISPSGMGLHLFLHVGDRLDLLTNRKSPYECYSKGRYFTFTEQPYNQVRPVRTVTKEEAEELLKIIGYPWKKEEVSVIPTVTTSISLDDSEVLTRMFASKNGSKIRATYDGQGITDESIADASLLSHLAFWTGKDQSQMERLWLSSPLGTRSKTQKRKDYRDRSIAHAVSNTREVYKKKEVLTTGGETIEFLMSVKMTANGIIESPIVNTENITRVLRYDPLYKKSFRYDYFKNSMECLDNGKWRSQEMSDVIKVQTQISTNYPDFSKVGKEMVADALLLVSKENQIDSAKDFISSLTWDQTPRLDTWLTSTYGAEDNNYHKAVGSNWLKGLVKRIFEPGCKFDHVLVLEGEQGTKKSTSLSVLGGDWHVETSMSTDNKDFFMLFQGKCIIEFSEGETLSRTEVKKMKSIITTQYDKYRPPYERLSQDFPRRCVFAMTTNESEYLKDDTGNRRWLPVAMVKPEADVEWMRENREQLLAEAHHRLYKLKESVHEFPIEDMKEEQSKRRIHDPNTEEVVNWYLTHLTEDQRNEGVTVNQAYDKIYKGSTGKAVDRLHEMIIAGIFKEVLKLEKIRVSRNGMQVGRYFNKGHIIIKDELDITTW